MVPELAHHLALVGVLLQLHVEEKNLKMMLQLWNKILARLTSPVCSPIAMLELPRAAIPRAMGPTI